MLELLLFIKINLLLINLVNLWVFGDVDLEWLYFCFFIGVVII